MCHKHAVRLRRTGTTAERPTLRQRLETKFIVTPGCWLWLGTKTRTGYGQIGISRSRMDYAHRVSYRLYVGPIPDGLHIDHLCRNTSCVNPDHLEPVTQSENNRRAAQSRSAS